MECVPFNDEEKKAKITELTSLFLHKHYCENNTELFLSCLDEVFSWFGTAEHEYATDPESVTTIMRSFTGKVPRCKISDEHYDVLKISQDIFICSGMLWIATDPSSEIYLRVHQRITAVYRWSTCGPRCCHLHISNPYSEMMEDDNGFPEKMSLESRKYFQEQIDLQKRQIQEQHDFIIQMYIQDMSTGLYNRNKFNQVCKTLRQQDCNHLGIAYFDLNGLKKTNDIFGHQAGDELIRRTAGHLLRAFGKKAYRIGGDEFIVIDNESDEPSFLKHVSKAAEAMQSDGISIAHGISWRASSGDIDAQIEEADKHMYLAKQQFYARKENNRRKR